MSYTYLKNISNRNPWQDPWAIHAKPLFSIIGWPDHLGQPPVPKVVISPRHPKGPRELDVPVDPVALAAGDHNGSTLYQHQRFNAAVRGEGAVDVSLRDGLIAVVMGLAAQESAATGQAISLTEGAFNVQALLG